MAKDAIVFAMANPIPKITPEEMPDNVAVVATGRSDYANMINNVPAFRGVFRGLLDRWARSVDISMKVAAARGLRHRSKRPRSGPPAIFPSPCDQRHIYAGAGRPLFGHDSAPPSSTDQLQPDAATPLARCRIAL